MTNTRRGIDWEAKLNSNEVGERKERGKTMQVVLLRGLQRLAEEAGIVRSRCQLFTPSPNLIQCVYTTEYSDGTSWDGAADCSSHNTTEPFLSYPTAVAESRAEARSIRKALGIRMLSAEELSLDAGLGLEASPSKGIDSSVVTAIERLCEERGVDKVDLINKIVSDKARANSIFEFKQLTTAEGGSAMSYLNGLPPVKKASKRSERKTELLKEIKDNG
jgi:hypothetical protein